MTGPIPGPNDPDTAYPVTSGGSGQSTVTTLMSTAAEGDSDTPLLRVRYSDETDAVGYYLRTGDPADGGDLWVMASGGEYVDLYAYDDQASVTVGFSGGAYVSTTVDRSEGTNHSAEILMHPHAGNAEIHQIVKNDLAQIEVKMGTAQTDFVLRIADSADAELLKIHANGEVELTAGQGIILHSPDASSWRVKVGNDGVLSTEAVT